MARASDRITLSTFGAWVFFIIGCDVASRLR
jgi:hypothetical protein